MTGAGGGGGHRAGDPAAEIERAFREGVGEPPPGGTLEVAVRSRGGLLFSLTATLRRPGRPDRTLAADVPVAARRQFARGLGVSLRSD